MRHFKVFLMVMLAVYLGMMPIATAESGETYFNYSNGGQDCSCQRSQDGQCTCTSSSDQSSGTCACSTKASSASTSLNSEPDVEEDIDFFDGDAAGSCEVNERADLQSSAQSNGTTEMDDATQAFGEEPLAYISNEYVLLLQKCLNMYIRFTTALRENEGEVLQPLAENGVFDPATEAAVRAFQSEFGIGENGVVDIETKERLYTLFAGSEQ